MKTRHCDENGYSLLELLIVIVILSILAVFVFTSFGRQKIQLQRQDSARQLKVSLERARSDSIKRRASATDEMARVTIDSPTSYVLSRDLNENGILETSEVLPVTLSPNNNFKIIGNFTVFPITIRFNFRGQVTATDGNNSLINPVFTICDSGCTLANAGVENSDVVAVSPTGTVSLLWGGKAPAKTVQSNISNVNVGQKINQGGTVNN